MNMLPGFHFEIDQRNFQPEYFHMISDAATVSKNLQVLPHFMNWTYL